MTTSELYKTITKTQPEVIYISGKTSTGKSTFAQRLHDELGYATVGLEEVLVMLGKANNLDESMLFHKVFYEDGPSKEKELYFTTTDEIIERHLHSNHRLVIEGAVANSATLSRILRPAGTPRVAYFHPDNLEPYVRNLTARFMQSSETSQGGLPLKFWQHIDEDEFRTFCKTRQLTEELRSAIRRYAQESQQASLDRLHELQHIFSDVTVVSIE